jgi:trimethylamine--corrinoid protein Co-methyltransferase
MEIYEGAGAVVDRKTKVVKIPPLVVEEAIQSVPSQFIACGRTPKNDVVLERASKSSTLIPVSIATRSNKTRPTRPGWLTIWTI